MTNVKSSLLDQAVAFRQVFNQEIQPGMVSCGFVKERLFDMQVRLIAEEANEFLEACAELKKRPNDIRCHIEVLKELCDLIFVCFQFAATYSLRVDVAMDRIYVSNMSKLDDDGKPMYRKDGKVLKGPNYEKPFLDDLVNLNHIQYDTSGKWWKLNQIQTT